MTQLEDLQRQVKKLIVEVDFLLEQIFVPEANCTCFNNAPCSDCVENSALREGVEDVRKAIKAIKETRETNNGTD